MMFSPMSGVRVETDDFDSGTWHSLLDLLHPSEFFIPVDQTALWRRHVAWGKANGKEIRNYVVQRFSSNMVFLSLLLGTDMSVLMNSSKITQEIRDALEFEQYYSLKFYVGAVMALASCVTVVGLVATYTAWSMISALSDSNSNTLLRSSMGQYVTAMPSKFVVASLYLFLMWLSMLFIQLISGPVVFVLLFIVAYLFFQVVVSLSAFGRLIIHTGAMGEKRVLDPEFERQLLPSGLHASLLIKATERSRRKTLATDQYRSKSVSVRDNSQALGAASEKTTPLDEQTGENDDLSVDDMQAIENTARKIGPSPGKSPASFGSINRERVASVDDLVEEIAFPRPSVLNRTVSRELRSVVNDTLSTRSWRNSMEQTLNDIKHGNNNAQGVSAPTDNSNPSNWSDPAERNPRRAHRQSVRASNVLSGNSRTLRQEWQEENDVRDIYDIEAPVQIDSNDEDDKRQVVGGIYMPRASILNKSQNFRPMRELMMKGMQEFRSTLRLSVKEAPNALLFESVHEENSSEEMESHVSVVSSDEEAGVDEAVAIEHDKSSLDDGTDGERQYLLSAEKK